MLGHETVMAEWRFRFPSACGGLSVYRAGARADVYVCVSYAAGLCRFATGDQLSALGIDPDELYALPLVPRGSSCMCSRARGSSGFVLGHGALTTSVGRPGLRTRGLTTNVSR